MYKNLVYSHTYGKDISAKEFADHLNARMASLDLLNFRFTSSDGCIFYCRFASRPNSMLYVVTSFNVSSGEWGKVEVVVRFIFDGLNDHIGVIFDEINSSGDLVTWGVYTVIRFGTFSDEARVEFQTLYNYKVPLKYDHLTTMLKNFEMRYVPNLQESDWQADSSQYILQQ